METQDGLIGVQFTLNEFEKYVSQICQIFDEMIQEGKTYKILDIYKRFFQKDKRYCGILILERLVKGME